MDGPITGHQMKLYRNTGTNETPVWVLIDEVEDVSIPDFTMGMAELKRRANNFTKGVPTIIQMITLEFKLWHNMDTTTQSALRTAHLAGTPLEFAVMNGAIATTGSAGWRIPVCIADFPWDQSLEEVSSHDLKANLAYMLDQDDVEIDPVWYVVS